MGPVRVDGAGRHRRLCEELGIAFFFQQREGREVLVITGTADVFEPIARSPPELHVSARREDRAAFDVVSSFARVAEAALVHDPRSSQNPPVLASPPPRLPVNPLFFSCSLPPNKPLPPTALRAAADRQSVGPQHGVNRVAELRGAMSSPHALGSSSDGSRR